VRVLVVDDHPEALAGICDLFEAQGHDVVGVADGRAAVEEAGFRTPDLVLVDARLHRESGLDVARSLIANHADLHVVIVSMNPVAPAAVRASGARAFVRKDDLAATDLHELRERPPEPAP
jgi:DNA-binding response OmpR family regulator